MHQVKDTFAGYFQNMVNWTEYQKKKYKLAYDPLTLYKNGHNSWTTGYTFLQFYKA